MGLMLTMIVRDEEATIARVIDHAIGVIDSYCIVDTGSVDATKEVALDKLKDVPGAWHDREWKNYGYNRTELAVLAWEADHRPETYMLCLDGDEMLHVAGEMPELTKEAYRIRYVGERMEWDFPKLLRSDIRWYWDGFCHALPEHGNGRPDQGDIPILTVTHEGDHKDRTAKVERDIALLSQEVAENPTKTRAVFYLAQSHKDVGNNEVAAAFYRQRVRLGGWPEEVFYANYMEGVVRWDESILLEAWARRPSRAEPLYQLARLCRQRGDFDAAMMYAERGLKIEQPPDVLFVHSWIYTHGLTQELALASTQSRD
jgi:tetratricopeptide (TPR) repeat protein